VVDECLADESGFYSNEDEKVTVLNHACVFTLISSSCHHQSKDWFADSLHSVLLSTFLFISTYIVQPTSFTNLFYVCMFRPSPVILPPYSSLIIVFRIPSYCNKSPVSSSLLLTKFFHKLIFYPALLKTFLFVTLSTQLILIILL
jgi:hypothetical protein